MGVAVRDSEVWAKDALGEDSFIAGGLPQGEALRIAKNINNLDPRMYAWVE